MEKYQTQDAKFQLLYENEWCVRDELLPVDRVYVELVGWSADGREVLIMTSVVKVDYEIIFTRHKVMNGVIADAIDNAAEQFADLLKAHPGYAPNNEPGRGE